MSTTPLQLVPSQPPQEPMKSAQRENRTARWQEVRDASRQRLLDKDIGHYLDWDDKQYQWKEPGADGEPLPAYLDNYNIYTPHRKSFQSILSQTLTGINFKPGSLQRGDDITAAAYAEKMRHWVDQRISIQERQEELAGFYCTDGRTIGKLLLDMFGVLESKPPLFISKMERWGYCILSEEEDVFLAKEENPEYAEEIEPMQGGSAEASYERWARLNVISTKSGVSADSYKNLVTRHNFWIRPSRYRKMPTSVKDQIRAMFPDGARCKIYGDTCVEVVPARMEDELVVTWPVPGKGQKRPSLLKSTVPIQDAFNDYKNHLREQADYIDPATWVDSDAVDSDALPEQYAGVSIAHALSPGPGKTVEQCVHQEQSNGLSPELIAECETLLHFAEYTTGDLPVLHGEADTDQETLGGQKLDTAAAKGQLSMPWKAEQRFFARVYTILITLAAQINADAGVMSVEGPNGQERFNPRAILDGEWGCYPDPDSAYPETTEDKRAAVQTVLSQLSQADPTIALQPDNLKLVKQLSGLDDLVIPGAEARDQALLDIEQLLQEQPVPNVNDPQWQKAVQQTIAQGQQPPDPPMMCSIEIDPDWDLHKPMADKVQEWLNSPAKREEMLKGNTLGVQNVKLYGKAHRDALAAQQQPSIGKPPNITVTCQVTDPTTIAQILSMDGVQANPQSIATSQVPDLQEQGAKTQHAAAQAQHVSVLAAKEAAVPPKTNFVPIAPPAPDQTGVPNAS